MKHLRSLIPFAIAVLVVPVWAADPPDANQDQEQSVVAPATTTTGHEASYSSDIGFRAWGLRAGVADDVDQVVGGAHFNLGEFVPHLRFQPDVQLGAGDDTTTLYGTVPVYYRFGTETRFTPYAGGGVSVGFVDRDLPAGSSGDESDFEVGGKVTGGLEWPRAEGQAFFLELSLGFGDVHDATMMAAWTF